MSKDKLEVQAVVFGKNWKTVDARKWLKRNKFKAIKRVHKTIGGFLRYRIVEPREKLPDGSLRYKRFTYKKTKKGIDFVLGIL